MDARYVVDLLYGSVSDLGTVAGELERTLGVTFELHDSDWRGGDYLRTAGWWTPDSETFLVQRNQDLDEPAEAEHAEYPTLLYVESTVRGSELEAVLKSTSLVLLRRTQRDAPRA
ncbi:hypothetical protein [Actinopolymorpha pittospori]|uniref:Uncharacterized protein n=1 Tax=Actinopolymorpha pittospori TaxID=648752 RepID=A0A927MS42_9ACTN|nr:hypothetical protein [Actinopolymorpha pittospori]MBE1605649.1 hypothetical protein [Actinopolymorpha pittospori]